MKKKKHIKRNLLVGLAGAALVAAIVYDKMNKEKQNTTTSTEDEVTSDEVVEAKEE